jgi:pyrroline-5-carboxylate reductase
VLRARVTSKGGTTERGIAALEAGGLHALVAGAVHAANVRAVELGEESGKDPR